MTSAPTVYTALFGGYEKLIEQPVAGDSSSRFVCFTDNDNLKSSSWQIVVTTPRLPWDPTRSARFCKMFPPQEARDSHRSLWIDNRVVLRQDPAALIEHLLQGRAMGLPHHSFRDSVREEFDAVISHGFDRLERVREQQFYMEKFAPSILSERPYWTAILAREHNDPVVQATMDDWWVQVLRHSRRDQLSINWAIWHNRLSVNCWNVDNFGSAFHEWRAVEKDATILKDRTFTYRTTQDLGDRWRNGSIFENWQKAKRKFRISRS